MFDVPVYPHVIFESYCCISLFRFAYARKPLQRYLLSFPALIGVVFVYLSYSSRYVDDNMSSQYSPLSLSLLLGLLFYCWKKALQVDLFILSLGSRSMGHFLTLLVSYIAFSSTPTSILVVPRRGYALKLCC